ncbi:MAG: RHS repeat-associated core domain-containing protein [Candidatus Aureabacteria bacterium]|nr:RHS repeat-associated core domain-containing protein [Candidatus Auribacterota bacterium]
MKFSKKPLCIFLIQLVLINIFFQYPLSFKVTEASAQTFYIHKDGLGSVRGISDEIGDVVATYSYDAFGNTRSQTGTVNNTYRFTTREYEPESDLYFLRARYYDPKIGRFFSKDSVTWSPDDRRILKGNRSELISTVAEVLKDHPIFLQNPNSKEMLHAFNNITLKSLILQIGSYQPQLLHKYVYCLNNPVNYIDPEGEFFVSAFVAGCVLLSAVAAIIVAQCILLKQHGDTYVRDKHGNIIGEMDVP